MSTSKPKRIIIAVTSDLVTDQRVHKVAQTCHDLGMDATLVGRRQPGIDLLDKRDYRTRRFRLLFHKKIWFYANYNIRLLFYLLFHHSDIILANDLDTLAACFLASRLKGIPLIYDSHEYFTEVPEIQARPLVKRVWTALESVLFPRLKQVYTVNDSIADIYSKKYRIQVKVIRNVPYLNQVKNPQTGPDLPELPADKKILIYQGAGINRQRGAEELVMSMSYLQSSEFLLLIVGSGDVIGDLKKLVTDQQLTDRIWFIDKLPFRKLSKLTRRAHLGLTLDKPTNLNYLYSLPNKLFDYIHAGIPVLASRLPEIERIISKYGIGDCIDSLEPEQIAAKIRFMFLEPARYQGWKQHTQAAARELCWEKESHVLVEMLETLSNDQKQF